MKKYIFVSQKANKHSNVLIYKKHFLKDISFIEANSDYINIYDKNLIRITTHCNLTLALKNLTPNFIRIHRSTIINMDYIKSIEQESIILNTVPEKIVTISDTCKNFLFAAIPKINA